LLFFSLRYHKKPIPKLRKAYAKKKNGVGSLEGELNAKIASCKMIINIPGAMKFNTSRFDVKK